MQCERSVVWVIYQNPSFQLKVDRQIERDRVFATQGRPPQPDSYGEETSIKKSIKFKFQLQRMLEM